MYTLYLHIIFIFFIYKICLPIKFTPNTFLLPYILTYLYLSLIVVLGRPLAIQFFTQIVSSYNYEKLIRSISTPFCLPLLVLIFLRPSISTPSFLPLYLCPLYLYAIFVPIFIRLYSYSFFYYSFSSYYLLLSPLYVHIICTPFSEKFFPKK